MWPSICCGMTVQICVRCRSPSGKERRSAPSRATECQMPRRRAPARAAGDHRTAAVRKGPRTMAENILPSSAAGTSMALNARNCRVDRRIGCSEGAGSRHHATEPAARPADRSQDRGAEDPGFSADGGNLYLDAWNLPSKNWVLRYSRNGRAHDCRKFRLDQPCERLIPG